MGEVKKDDGSNDAIMYAAAAVAILGAVFWALARLPAFILYIITPPRQAGV